MTKENSLDTTKQQYLERIRRETAYPMYRNIIGIIAILGFVMAGLVGLGSLILSLGIIIAGFSNQNILAGLLFGLICLVQGLVWAAIIFFLARFWKEASLILVDIGDSITDANAKRDSGVSA